MVNTRRVLGAVILSLMTGCATLLPEGAEGDPTTAGEKAPKTLFAWQVGPKEPEKESGEGGKEAGVNGDAEEEPDVITTDRPDFTEASSTVGRGRIQLEAGYTYSRDRHSGVTSSHSYPEALLRIGMFADWFELRVGQNFSNSRGLDTDALPVRTSGPEDLYLGVKLGLTEQRTYLPEAALILQATVPTGPSDLTAGRTLPGLNLLYGWDVTDFLSVGASTQANAAVDGDDHPYLELAQSLTVGYTLTEQLGAYTEFFTIAPHGAIAPGATPQHYFNGGFTYKLTPDLQFDIRAGVGLNRSAEDYFLGSGFAVRY